MNCHGSVLGTTAHISFQLNVDTSVVDFGAAVIGETLKRTITLRNSGALGTTFKFQKVSDMKQREATSPQPSPEVHVPFTRSFSKLNCSCHGLNDLTLEHNSF